MVHTQPTMPKRNAEGALLPSNSLDSALGAPTVRVESTPPVSGRRTLNSSSGVASLGEERPSNPDLLRQRDAFRALRARWMQIPARALVQPRAHAALMVTEAEELEELLARPAVRCGLDSVGISRGELDDLPLALDAVRYVEACLRRARPGSAETIEEAARLRDELRASCRWNLRGRQASEALARITDSDDAGELALDLRELAELIATQHAAFGADTTLDVSAAYQRALSLAQQLNALASPVAGVKPEWLELRVRAYTHLMSILDLLRQAGRYAFRSTPALRVWFTDPGGARLRTAMRIAG